MYSTKLFSLMAQNPVKSHVLKGSLCHWDTQCLNWINQMQMINICLDGGEGVTACTLFSRLNAGSPC